MRRSISRFKMVRRFKFKIQKFKTSEMRRSRRKVNGGKIKEAVSCVCEVLREYYGIGTITAELLRQSKLGRKAAVRFCVKRFRYV